jgi:hypothetical protein
MLVDRCEEVISRLKPGISIKKVMMIVFSQRGSKLSYMPSLKGRNIIKNILFRTYFRLCLMKRNVFQTRKLQLIYLCMNILMCHNGHQIIDELHCLKILRVPHLPHLPNISPCDFWMFGYFKGRQKYRDLQNPKEILRTFHELWNNIIFEELQIAFESWRDRLRWIIEHDEEYFRK